MKTTDQASDRKDDTKAPATHWYRVRPALLAALALGVAIWMGLLGYGAMRVLGSGELLETVARLVGQYGGAMLNVLAVAAVGAVAVEGLRTSHRRRNAQRKPVCSLRAPHDSRPARA